MKFNLIIRFTYIETQLYWGDGVSANDLKDIFGITRQTAQAILDEYREKHPGQMTYNRHKKRHVASEHFEPYYISTQTIAFLDYLRGQRLREHYLEDRVEWSDIKFTDIDRKLRPQLSRSVIQPILAALRHKKTVSIEYHPMLPDDDIQVRIISPNRLVFVDNRYHLHAYCHSKNRHLDFVLSRILWVEPADEEWVSYEGSQEWHQQVTLRFRPNRELPETVQKTLLQGYSRSENGILEIRCNKNEAFYIRRQLLRKFDENRHMPLWIEITE